MDLSTRYSVVLGLLGLGAGALAVALPSLTLLWITLAVLSFWGATWYGLRMDGIAANALQRKRTPIASEPAPEQRARTRLWELRRTGVEIRNRLIQATEVDDWLGEYEEWRADVLEAARAISSELRNHLETLNEIAPPPGNLSIASADHEHALAIMSEVLRRLGRYLERTL